MYVRQWKSVYVCLPARLLKKRVHGFRSHFACRQVSGHGRTGQLLSPIRMPEPYCFLTQRMHCNAEFYYVGQIRIGRQLKQRRVVLRHQNTVVGGKCALPSALLVHRSSRERYVCCQSTLAET